MKFYIASRFNLKDKVREIHNRLIKRGHEVSGDWLSHDLIKPYGENKLKAQEYAEDDINGVNDCDVFVLVSDEAGTGMYIELGAAIQRNLKTCLPAIYIIGEHTERAMFYFHRLVHRKSGKDLVAIVDEVLSELGE